MSITQHHLTLDAPVLLRLLPKLSELADELFAAGLATVPGAEQVPDELFADDVAARIISGTMAVLRAVDERRDVDEHELIELITPIVEQRAEERIPLRVLITAFFGSVRLLWRKAAAAAAPEDLPDLIALSEILLEVLQRSTIAMAETHADVERSLYGSEREARRELCAALLRGSPTADLAARADITIAESYDMIALQVVPPDHSIPLVDNAIARRRMQRAQHALEELAGGTTALHTFDGAAGIALLPPGPIRGAAQYAALAADLEQIFNVPVVIIDFGAVVRADLPESSTQITEFGVLARKLGRPTGAYRLDDLMLEYQLTRPGPARDRLASRITPLIEHPHLLETLEIHIRYGWDRKSAAAAMHLHPNSFSYRLRRIAELTGFDPADPYDSRMLAAALTVYRLSEPEPAFVPN
ncbi:PucR family transcriptional regulator [Nocardia sp. NPDC056100]|uniref:PucR family transcriptional regulator n=1 Tax=Nocardia sp. NPDC056100 TaxID=3345712 RepID=UPI0035E01E34